MKYGPQLYGDYFINHEIRIPISQPVIQWKVGPCFFRGSWWKPWGRAVVLSYVVPQLYLQVKIHKDVSHKTAPFINKWHVLLLYHCWYTNIAGKWDWVDVFPIENGDFPASYVSLPEGTRKYHRTIKEPRKKGIRNIKPVFSYFVSMICDSSFM